MQSYYARVKLPSTTVLAWLVFTVMSLLPGSGRCPIAHVTSTASSSIAGWSMSRSSALTSRSVSLGVGTSSDTSSASAALSRSSTRSFSSSSSPSRRGQSASIRQTMVMSLSDSLKNTSLTFSRSMSPTIALSESCNSNPVSLRGAFVASNQSVVPVVQAEVVAQSDGSELLSPVATFPPLQVTNAIAESIAATNIGGTDDDVAASLNFSIHLFESAAVSELDARTVLTQVRIQSTYMQSASGNQSSDIADAHQSSSGVHVRCAWRGLEWLPIIPPHIFCRVFNASMGSKPFADVALVASVVVGCDHLRSTLVVPMTILARPIPLESIAQVMSGVSSAASGVVGGNVAASSAARSGAIMKVLSCSNPGAEGAGSGGLFSLSVGDGPLAESFGAIVSLGLAIVIVYAIALVVVFVVMQRHGGPLTAALFIKCFHWLYLDSLPLILFMVFGTTVISASTALASHNAATTSTVAVGCVAFCVTGATFLLGVHQVVTSPSHVHSEPTVPADSGSPQSSGCLAKAARSFQRLLWKHHRWVATNKGSTTSSASLAIVPIASDLRIMWPILFDMFGNLVAGVVAGIPGLSSTSTSAAHTACVSLTSVMVLGNVLQLVACIALRPMASVFAHVYTMYMLCLSTAMCSSVIAFLVFADDANNSPFGTSRTLATSRASAAAAIAVYLSMAVSATTLIKTILDGCGVAHFFWRRSHGRHGCCGTFQHDPIPIVEVVGDDFVSLCTRSDIDEHHDCNVDVVDLLHTTECNDVFGLQVADEISDPLRQQLVSLAEFEDEDDFVCLLDTSSAGDSLALDQLICEDSPQQNSLSDDES